jgi:peptide/nickel transport system ATP-binding protein
MNTDTDQRGEKGDILLDMRDVRIDGFSDERWHHIIKGVDLTLKRGEVLGLIGESGAGKSTLGKAAMGYAQPGCKIKSGSIMFDGMDLMAATEAEKRELWGSRIAYVAQSAAASFNPAHRLLDQTIEATVGHNVNSDEDARRDAVELYDSLSLPEPNTIGERYPHQVSGGQLQRIMTAMAMSPRPDLIIFDEPTTALDVTTQVEVLLAMRNIVERFNTAAIYITHDLAVVAQMADRIKSKMPTPIPCSLPRKKITPSLFGRCARWRNLKALQTT